MDKVYEPAKYESDIYQKWEQSGAFSPTKNADAEPFSIIMPPPNANGSLHAGHLMYVVEDIATRYSRMQGRPTLWLPGTDHAGIETQYVYEKKLEAEGKSRFDLGPQKFYDEVMVFTQAQQGTIITQMKSMGFSADWSKLKFTLAPDIIDTVYDTFIHMHKEGYIYRGNRIVNWCPRCGAAFPDIETDHIEREGKFYTLDYGALKIATTRPETIFADVAVAVNPKDPRYKNLIGQTATIPIIDRVIPIIADEHVDQKAGTGALKVTPGHDFNDYEIGLRHNLAEITVIDFEGKMINVPEEYAGLPVAEARQKVAEALNSAGKLIEEKTIVHAVAIHDRCGTVIEPLLSEQWFLRIKELNKPVIDAIESEAVKFHPPRFKRLALDWLKQEHDWCISRPGWWGIRIPVYYMTNNDPSKEPHFVAKTEDEARKYYGEGNYRAETDTFDTWFSSSQLPYADLMATGDFEQFYPTTLMATARDILHKWVTRMIMFSLYVKSEVPFRNVYLWGMVTDEKGQKLSKSKGNYGDPLEITAQYGTDALRLALSIGITPGNDDKLSEEKIAGYRNFCNKLWNVARFSAGKVGEGYMPSAVELKTPADHWIAERLNQTVTKATEAIEAYRFSEAGQLAYALLWDDFADKYIESAKSNLNANLLIAGLEVILKLIHPFAPFVSEAIWQELPWHKSLLISESWPELSFQPDSKEAEQFQLEVIDMLAKADEGRKQAALQREISAKQNLVRLTETKLTNDAFIKNAPEQVVTRERELLAQTKVQLKQLEGEIGKLTSS